jgi:hypothetical protein
MTRLFLATAVLAVAIAFGPIAGIEALVQTGVVETGTVQTRPAPTAVRDTNAAAGASAQALLGTYCYSCHNTRVQMGGLALHAAGDGAEPVPVVFKDSRRPA